jgi:hypothetical protein
MGSEVNAMDQQRATELRRRGSGFCFEAPGVYLWDEDPREVVRAALELRLGNARPRAPQRMLVIPRQEVAPPRR